jgi:predicted RNA-binding Zn-ribbon protein involved in translation (DUF1610 family)
MVPPETVEVSVTTLVDVVKLRSLVRTLCRTLGIMTDAAGPNREASEEFRAEARALIADALGAIGVAAEPATVPCPNCGTRLAPMKPTGMSLRCPTCGHMVRDG